MLSEEIKAHNCSLSGIVTSEENIDIFSRLLQMTDSQRHRGDEGAGIAFLSNTQVKRIRGIGERPKSLPYERILNLPPSSMAISHTRYSTAGSPDIKNIQPFVFDKVLALAHNGNVRWQKKPQKREPTSDSFGIGKEISRNKGPVETKIISTIQDLNGAYVIFILSNEGLYIARDPWGLRPCEYGEINSGINGYAVASETVGLHKARAVYGGTLERGRLVKMTAQGPETIWEDPRTQEFPYSFCSFERSYFADASSRSGVDDLTNHSLRVQLGQRVARRSCLSTEVVMPVPNSGRSYAEGTQYVLKKSIVEGIQTNRYRGRTFLQPNNPTERKEAAFFKYNFIRELIQGRKITIVDDSVVRGFTQQGLILALFEYGASEIEVLLGVPPITHPCYWGIDFADKDELIFHQLGGDLDSFEEKLAFWVVNDNKKLASRLKFTFQRLTDYVQVTSGGNTNIDTAGCCYHCVSGKVPKGLIADPNHLKNHLEE